MEVDYILGERKNQVYGIGRIQREVFGRLKEKVDFNILNYRSTRNRLSFGFYRYIYYPLQVKRNCRENSVKHITNQSYAYLLNRLNLKRTVVTCYDIIPSVMGIHVSYLSQKMTEYDMRGLVKADHIIAISEHSKGEICDRLGYPEEQVSVIYPGVDNSRFYHEPSKEILRKYGITGEGPVILNVGSEMPHKNLHALIRAFRNVKEKMPDAKLVKVGEPSWPNARDGLEALIKNLGLKDVIFLNYIEEDDLPKLYNSADLFVFPSLYEGFGLPPLEAMACGTPTISSNASSLPEVVGDAGILVDSLDVNTLAEKMYEVLTNEKLRERLMKNGIVRAKMFTWEKSAEETVKVYEEVYNGRS